MEEIGSNRRTGQHVAVVVGAGGMGMALARRLGDTYRVVVADRDAKHLERQVAALRSEGHDASGVVCDVTDEDAVEALADTATSKGSVRALAHVVGISPSLGDGATVLRVNLVGPTLVDNAFLSRAEPGFAAVFIASMAGHREPLTHSLRAILDDALVPDLVERVEAHIGGALSPFLAYQLSKGALIRHCQRRVSEWGAVGARIMSLSPGIIAPPQGAREFVNNPIKQELYGLTPLEREGTMLEIADAVEFLLSDRASFITGVDLLVDGGLNAAIRNKGEVDAGSPADASGPS